MVTNLAHCITFCTKSQVPLPEAIAPLLFVRYNAFTYMTQD